MNVLQIHPNDNVWIALKDLLPGEAVTLDGATIVSKYHTPQKHKFAITDINQGEPIIMYGIMVGKAVAPIKCGEVITTANVRHAATTPELRYRGLKGQPSDTSAFTKLTFDGYHRTDGKVGTANYWLVFPLVFCENHNVKLVRELLEEKLGYHKSTPFTLNVDKLISGFKKGYTVKQLLNENIYEEAIDPRENPLFPNVSGIKFLTHEGGCGGTRSDSEALCALMAGYVNNANVAGATVLSLGCQNAQVDMFKKALYKINPSFDKPLYIIGQQETGNLPNFIAQAVQSSFVGMVQANDNQRKPAPLSKLIIGLECGGSDGFSGISANPVVGHCSDLLIGLGGTTVLAEFPELHGVEQNLIDRCVSLTVASRFMELMERYAEAAKKAGTGFEMNPSPGNIKDGLITDAMKSAGAARKGGTSPISDVLDYTEQVTVPGLNLLCTPGNDVESTTALAASGCTMILFTTGLGTPTGNPVAPVVKISSNTKLAIKMKDTIDFDAGTIFSAGQTIQERGADLLHFVVSVASGKETPQAVRLHQDDFIPWKRDISL
ncbi:MAG: UxaA family hydrolase [Cyclobacteriaceae bacterium]